MKYLEVDVNKCLACGRCEIECSKTFFKDENKELSSIRVIKGDDNKVIKLKVCNQCGACIDVCPTQALKRTPQGHVLLNKKLCVGCLSCIGFCPTLDMHLPQGSVTPFKCVACGACVKVCEPGALKIVEKVAAK
ncbi:MAG: 4Fe-4S binding protein [Cyanobacteriota bacterium]